MKNKSGVSSTIQHKAGSSYGATANSQTHVADAVAADDDFGLQDHPAGNVSYGILLRLPIPSADYFYNCRN